MKTLADYGLPLRAPCGTAQGKRMKAADRQDGRPRKRNTYLTVCFVCGTKLAPGEGVIERSDTYGWTAFCASGGPR